MEVKEKGFAKKMNDIPNLAWLLISLALAFAFWNLLAVMPQTSLVFASPGQVVQAFFKEVGMGVMWQNISISLFRVLAGFV